MKFFESTLTRSTAILIAGLFIAAMGLKALVSMPRSLFPELNYPRVLVEINMGYTPLSVMEWGVTSILEKELRAVPGVRLVKSSSSRGQSSIDVFLREGEDVTLGIQRVNAKIAGARALIPLAAQISVRPITAAAFPSAEYCFTSKTKNPRDLRTFVEYTVKPLIMVIPGIFDAKVAGGDLPELSVELDPRKMALRNLTVADINDRLKNSSSVDFLGPVEDSESQMLAFGGKFATTAREIENVVVDSSLGRAVRISDLGRARLRSEWKTKDVSLNGTECVVLDVYYQSGIDQKATSTGVAATVENVMKENPEENYRSWDLNDFTDSATNAVLLDLAVGMIIITLVTLLFLRNFRYSFIALLSMPLAACLTFLAMSFLGLSINLMTLGGLTAAIGLVVDNTVIVLEMYHHRLSQGRKRSKRDVLVETLRAVVKPMIFGTATIALVFTPISYLSGVSGMFFAPMAHVHSAALVVSVLLALFLVPGLILLIDGASDDLAEDQVRGNRITRGYRRLVAWRPRRSGREPDHEDHFDDGRFARGYRRLMAWCLDRSLVGTLLLFLIPMIAFAAFPFARTGFLPEWDEGDLVIDFRAVKPIALKTTVQKIRKVEEYLKTEIPEIDFFIRKAGTGLGSYNKVPYDGEFILKLKEKRHRSVFEIKDDITARLEKMDETLEFDLFQILPDRLNDLSGSAKPLVVYLHGDESVIDEAAAKYKKALTEIAGLESVRIGEPEPSPELQFDLDETRTRALDLNPTVVDESVRFGLFSVDSTTVQIGPRTVPIRLRSLDQKPGAGLADVSMYTSRGGLETVTKLGRIERKSSRIESNHIDGSPVRELTAEISGRDLGSVMKDVQAVLKKEATPGIHFELGGDFQLQQQSFSELVLAFLVGIVLIMIVALFFTNRLSVAIPLTACSLVPPTIGLLGCVIFRIPLDVSSFSGLISVTGIAVANSFMALSAIEELPNYFDKLRESVMTGMVSRLRPILMTNLAAMAGFVPIAIGFAKGDEILRPFSIAIIAGIFGAAYTTLILVPAFYTRFAAKAD